MVLDVKTKIEKNDSGELVILNLANTTLDDPNFEAVCNYIKDQQVTIRIVKLEATKINRSQLATILKLLKDKQSANLQGLELGRNDTFDFTEKDEVTIDGEKFKIFSLIEDCLKKFKLSYFSIAFNNLSPFAFNTFCDGLIGENLSTVYLGGNSLNNESINKLHSLILRSKKLNEMYIDNIVNFDVTTDINFYPLINSQPSKNVLINNSIMNLITKAMQSAYNNVKSHNELLRNDVTSVKVETSQLKQHLDQIQKKNAELESENANLKSLQEKMMTMIRSLGTEIKHLKQTQNKEQAQSNQKLDEDSNIKFEERMDI